MKIREDGGRFSMWYEKFRGMGVPLSGRAFACVIVKPSWVAQRRVGKACVFGTPGYYLDP